VSIEARGQPICPFNSPAKFQMRLNSRTAKALGLVVPQSIFLRADEVIE
jgi:hypothetical protein